MEDRELLVRIDERLQNLTAPGGDLSEIKERLSAINSNCVKHNTRITRTEDKIGAMWIVFVGFLAAVGTAIARLWAR